MVQFKSLLISSFLIGFCIQANALVAESGLVKVDSNRSVYYESEIFDNNQKTLVLLPGIFRGLGLRTKDKLILALSQQKTNWVTFHFSGHPQSLIATKGQNSNLEKLTLKDLADEVRAVIKQLKIQKPYISTLSYSSAPASDFTKYEFSKIIETAPIGSQDEENDSMKPYIDATDFWCGLNPFCSPIWEAQKEAAYRQHWQSEVNRMSSVYPEIKSEPLHTLAIDGYVGMARATEKYELEKQDFSKGPERIFILGENEEKNRFEMQISAIKNIQNDKGSYPYVFIVAKAGHIVPTDQPGSYLKVLNLILTDQLSKTSRVFLVKTSGEIVALTDSEVSKIFGN